MPTATPGVRHFTMPQPINDLLADTAQAQPVPEGPTKAKKVEERYPEEELKPLASHAPHTKPGITFSAQDSLPKLPIPELDRTIERYLAALKPLQSTREHAETRQAAEEFARNDGPELQEKLKKYATGQTSYIEQFCRFRVRLIRIG